jgi:hypothetical protein
MKNINTLILLVISALIIGQIFYLTQLQFKVEAQFVKYDSLSVSESNQLKGLELMQDSLVKTDIVLSKSIIYLDSCQSTKQSKAERAERRGKFVGGILKSLFPGL